MAVSDNTCYEVVNISWLKALVGSAVQNDSGQTVNVSEVSGTTYCPTYEQLTNNTFIPYRSVSSDGPADDVDGITVNGTCYATGEAYQSNQLVNKHDVAVCNTRLESFSVSAASGNLDACSGGTRDLSYTRTFTRNTWDMLDCETTYESRHTSTSATDTRNSLISWTPNVGSIVDSTTAGSGKAVSVGKNKASSSSPSTRTVEITGSCTFRTETTTARTSVTQNAVTGGWIENSYGDENFRADGVAASTSQSFACVGGNYGGMAKYKYDVRTYYVWRDNCNPQETYYDITKSEVKDADKDKTGTTKSKSSAFTNVTSTGLDGNSRSATLSWNGETYCGATWGESDVLTFTQTCYAPPTDCTNTTGDSTEQTASIECAGGDVPFNNISLPVTARTVNGYNQCVSSTTTTTTSTTVTVGCYSGSTERDVTGTKDHVKYKITQSSGTCTCTKKTVYTFGTGQTPEQSCACSGDSNYKVTGGTVPYTAVTDNGDGTSSTTESSVSGISFNVNIPKCTSASCYPSDDVSVSISSPVSTSVTIHYVVAQVACSECYCQPTYGQVNVYQTTGGLTELPSSGGTYYFSSSTIPYSAYTSEPTAEGCSECAYSGSAYTSCTTSAVVVEANATSSAKTISGTDNHIHYEITQAAGTKDCPTDNVFVKISNEKIAAGGPYCIAVAKYRTDIEGFNFSGATTSNSNIATTCQTSIADETHNYLQVNFAANPNTTDRNITITAKFTGSTYASTGCSYSLTFTQAGKKNCDCDSLKFNLLEIPITVDKITEEGHCKARLTAPSTELQDGIYDLVDYGTLTNGTFNMKGACQLYSLVQNYQIVDLGTSSGTYDVAWRYRSKPSFSGHTSITFSNCNGATTEHWVRVTATGYSPFSTATNLYLVNSPNYTNASTFISNLYRDGVSIGGTGNFGKIKSYSNCEIAEFTGTGNIVNGMNNDNVVSRLTPKINQQYYVIAIEAGNTAHYRIFNDVVAVWSSDTSCTDITLYVNWARCHQ